MIVSPSNTTESPITHLRAVALQHRGCSTPKRSLFVSATFQSTHHSCNATQVWSRSINALRMTHVGENSGWVLDCDTLQSILEHRPETKKLYKVRTWWNTDCDDRATLTICVETTSPGVVSIGNFELEKDRCCLGAAVVRNCPPIPQNTGTKWTTFSFELQPNLPLTFSDNIETGKAWSLQINRAPPCCSLRMTADGRALHSIELASIDASTIFTIRIRKQHPIVDIFVNGRQLHTAEYTTDRPGHLEANVGMSSSSSEHLVQSLKMSFVFSVADNSSGGKMLGRIERT